MANTDFLYLKVLLSDNPSVPLTLFRLCLPIWRFYRHNIAKTQRKQNEMAMILTNVTMKARIIIDFLKQSSFENYK